MLSGPGEIAKAEVANANDISVSVINKNYDFWSNALFIEVMSLGPS